MCKPQVFPPYHFSKPKAYFRNGKCHIGEYMYFDKRKIAALKERIIDITENGKESGYSVFDVKGREFERYTDSFDKEGKKTETILARRTKEDKVVIIRKKAPFYDNHQRKITESVTKLLDEGGNKIAEKTRITTRSSEGISNQIFKFKTENGRLFFNKTENTLLLCEYDPFNFVTGRIDAYKNQLAVIKSLTIKLKSSLAKHLLKTLKK